MRGRQFSSARGIPSAMPRFSPFRRSRNRPDAAAQKAAGGRRPMSHSSPTDDMVEWEARRRDCQGHRDRLSAKHGHRRSSSRGRVSLEAGAAGEPSWCHLAADLLLASALAWWTSPTPPSCVGMNPWIRLHENGASRRLLGRAEPAAGRPAGPASVYRLQGTDGRAGHWPSGRFER